MDVLFALGDWVEGGQRILRQRHILSDPRRGSSARGAGTEELSWLELRRAFSSLRCLILARSFGSIFVVSTGLEIIS